MWQINDDIRLVTRGWAEEFVGTLRANAYVPSTPLAPPNPRLSMLVSTLALSRDWRAQYVL